MKYSSNTAATFLPRYPSLIHSHLDFYKTTLFLQRIGNPFTAACPELPTRLKKKGWEGGKKVKETAAPTIGQRQGSQPTSSIERRRREAHAAPRGPLLPSPRGPQATKKKMTLFLTVHQHRRSRPPPSPPPNRTLPPARQLPWLKAVSCSSPFPSKVATKVPSVGTTSFLAGRKEVSLCSSILPPRSFKVPLAQDGKTDDR